MQDDNIFIEFQNQQKEITYYLGDHMYDETIVLSTVTISQTHRIEEFLNLGTTGNGSR